MLHVGFWETLPTVCMSGMEALTFINVNREPFLASFGREVRLDCRCAEIESACLKNIKGSDVRKLQDSIVADYLR